MAAATILETTEKCQRSSRPEQKHASKQAHKERPVLAMICNDSADGTVGARLVEEAEALARRGRSVHVFCRTPFPLHGEGIHVHEVGGEAKADLVDDAHEFATRVGVAFKKTFSGSAAHVVTLGKEWSCVPALLELSAIGVRRCLLSMHSLERMRSDMRSELSRRIEQLEQKGIAFADKTLLYDEAAAEHARRALPACADRLWRADDAFPIDDYRATLDAGAVKARYQIGPVDPTLLFVGDLDDRHGADILLKSMPALVAQNRQIRLIIAGDGGLMWPLRVRSRYMLLDYAVRIIGHVSGRPVRELIAAADVVVVPSRVRTEDWQILSGWAASRPVIATREVASALCAHEQDSVIVEPKPESLVAGIDHVLRDADFAKRIAAAGYSKVCTTHGTNRVAVQLEVLMDAPVADAQNAPAATSRSEARGEARSSGARRSAVETAPLVAV